MDSPFKRFQATAEVEWRAEAAHLICMRVGASVPRDWLSEQLEAVITHAQ